MQEELLAVQDRRVIRIAVIPVEKLVLVQQHFHGAAQGLFCYV